MKTALIISGSAHAIVLGAALFSFAAPPPLEMVAPDVVPIEIVPIEEVARAVKGDAKAPLKPVPAVKPTARPPREEPAVNVGDTDVDVPTPEAPVRKAPPVEKTAEAPPPPPAAKPEPEPKPEPRKAEPAPEPEPKQLSLLDRSVVPKVRPEPPKPKPSEKALPKKPEPPKKDTAQEDAAKKAKAEADKKRKADAKVKADAKAKADEKAREQAEAKAKADQIKALLDKQKAAAGGAKRSETAAARGTKKGNAPKLSRGELDGLRAQVMACFGVPAVGGADPSALRVSVEFELNQDGTLDGKPRVTKSAGPDDRSKRSFAGAARRAVAKCGRRGFDLPEDKFEAWREVEVNFSLADML